MDVLMQYCRNKQDLQQQTKAEPLNKFKFIEDLPSIDKFCNMEKQEIYLWLSKLPTSQYHGRPIWEIRKRVTLRDALKEINIYVMQNELCKANLHPVSEQSKESASMGDNLSLASLQLCSVGQGERVQPIRVS